jgi:hypothetical protein
MARRVLVAEDADQSHQFDEGELLGQRRRERLRPGRVVRGVHEHRRRAANDFQPARRGDLGKGFTHDVDRQWLLATTDERLSRGESQHGVVRLVRAVEIEEEVGIVTRETAHADLLARRRRYRGPRTPKSLPSYAARAPASSARS